jgi:hypothetical protein
VYIITASVEACKRSVVFSRLLGSGCGCSCRRPRASSGMRMVNSTAFSIDADRGSPYALLNRNASLSKDEIKHAITRNLCTCTGYHYVVGAIKIAANKEITA